MRFMVIVKANKDSEAGVMPSQQLLSDMGKYNEELVRAGAMLAGEGLQPSVKGTRCQATEKPFSNSALYCGWICDPYSIALLIRSFGGSDANS